MTAIREPGCHLLWRGYCNWFGLRWEQILPTSSKPNGSMDSYVFNRRLSNAQDICPSHHYVMCPNTVDTACGHTTSYCFLFVTNLVGFMGAQIFIQKSAAATWIARIKMHAVFTQPKCAAAIFS